MTRSTLSLFAFFLALGLLLSGCDATSTNPATPTPSDAPVSSKLGGVSITIDGPRQVAPGQECQWAAVVDGSYSSIDWYINFNQQVGSGAYHQTSFQSDTPLEVKVYDQTGNFLNSAYIDVEVCEGCEAPEDECTNLTPVPSPL